MFVVLLATLFFVEAVVIEVLALVANAIFPKEVGVPAYFHKTLREKSDQNTGWDNIWYHFADFSIYYYWLNQYLQLKYVGFESY